MVKGNNMLISDFARATGISRDTVRFYVRLGLLQPQLNSKGGRHPYQVFVPDHVRAVKIIRVAQSLGMPLREISAISKERREGRMTRRRSIETLQKQLNVLGAKAAEVRTMQRYLRAKIDWLEGGEQGPPPDFEKHTVKK
jgi:MerR family copper efflux transcriptional regulator